jgi:HlyD family secretion protein
MRNTITLVLIALLLIACGNDEVRTRVVGELASDRIELTAEFAEPIVEIAVAEGELVSEGQLLLRQDSTRAQARLAQADAALAQSQARLDELVRGPRREKIAAARANLDGAAKEQIFRQSDYARTLEVYERKLASPEALDRAKSALDSASSNLASQKAQLEELLAGTTAEELEQAEQAVQQGRASVDAARVDLLRLEIRAPVAGIMDSRPFELGERPGPGQAVAIMLPAKQPHARVYIPEEMRVHVRAGSAATIYVDGLAEPLNGRIRWISSEAAYTPYFALTERDRKRLTYMAKVDIVDEVERLPDGIPVEVELDLGSQINAD